MMHSHLAIHTCPDLESLLAQILRNLSLTKMRKRLHCYLFESSSSLWRFSRPHVCTYVADMSSKLRRPGKECT